MPKKIDFYALATTPATSASVAVTVPRSRLLTSIAAAQHGIVNLEVVVESATHIYPRMLATHLNTRGTTAVAVAGIDRTSFRRPSGGTMLPSRVNPRFCVAQQIASTEGVTRLGELHVASLAGAGGEYVSSVQADSTISVGFSHSGKAGTWSVDGNASLSNTISSSGGYTAGAGFGKYVDGHVYYGKFREVCTQGIFGYFVEATSTPGDVFSGTSTAPPNPYGTCHADPNHLARIGHPNGFWNDDHSQAKTYSGIFTWFGFSFGGSNGFTHDVLEQWWDRDSKYDDFICGNVDPVQDSSVFWNDRN